jgi:DNA-binding transcriptional regulator PaaX
LKFPEIPNELTPKSWKGYNIRFMVKNIYDGLTPQAETWLNLPTEKSVINFGNFKTPKRF